MSRRVHCDNCHEVIPWVDGNNVNAKRINKEQKNLPPITARGQGYALDFCSPGCLGTWGINEHVRLGKVRPTPEAEYEDDDES